MGIRIVDGVGLFRRSCAVCGRSGEALCEPCLRRLAPPPATRVRGVGRVSALFAYEGTGAAVVQALKFRDGRRLVSPLADALAEHVDRRPDMVCTWLPTTAARRRARGFDQSELLARAVARRLQIPCVRLLRRRAGESQTGLDRAHRADNVVFRTVATTTAPVLVLDDVCTTGATLRAAVSALSEAGIDTIRCITVARTP